MVQSCGRLAIASGHDPDHLQRITTPGVHKSALPACPSPAISPQAGHGRHPAPRGYARTSTCCPLTRSMCMVDYIQRQRRPAEALRSGTR